MRIMYITDQMYLHGGVEKMLAAKINSWIQDFGYEVILITSEQKNKDFIYQLDSRLKHVDLGIDYQREKSYFHPANLQKVFGHVSKLKNKILEFKPDIIVSPSFAPEQYVLPYIVKKIPKIKEIHFSGHILQPQTGRFSPKKLMDRFFGNYTRVVVLNEDERKY